MKLPKSHGYNSIWVVCNHLTWVAHLCLATNPSLPLTSHGYSSTKSFTTRHLLHIIYKLMVSWNEQIKCSRPTYVHTALINKTTGSTISPLPSFVSTIMKIPPPTKCCSLPMLPITHPGNPILLNLWLSLPQTNSWHSWNKFIQSFILNWSMHNKSKHVTTMPVTPLD